MSAREPAHPIEKRDLLHAESPNRTRIVGIGKKLAQEGRWPEAVDYLERYLKTPKSAQNRAEVVAALVAVGLLEAFPR